MLRRRRVSVVLRVQNITFITTHIKGKCGNITESIQGELSAFVEIGAYGGDCSVRVFSFHSSSRLCEDSIGSILFPIPICPIYGSTLWALTGQMGTRLSCHCRSVL